MVKIGINPEKTTCFLQTQYRLTGRKLYEH